VDLILNNINMERRKFFRNFAVGGSLLLTAPVLFNSCSDDLEDEKTPAGGITVDLTDPVFTNLKTVGGYSYKGDIIIIRSSDAVYIALSKVCTHQQNTVIYNSGTNELVCPLHGSKFTKEGTVISGQASSPLKKYDVKQNGNILTIS
jgi:cytochrome b6-f complex iron-sulfur subunit